MLHDTDLHNSLPIRRVTAEEIVAHRNRALALYADAHDAIAAAAEAIAVARREAEKAAPTKNRFNIDNHRARITLFDNIKVPDREAFLDAARRITDTDVWAHLISSTQLESLMDKKAKDDFAKQLQEDPPEVTVENLLATVEGLFADAGTIFRRGIANCFSSLDRRFKSHDGWKIGSRIILSGMFDSMGRWNYYRNARDTLRDVERAFLVLDGRPADAMYGGIVDALEEARCASGGLFRGARQTVVESEFYRLRVFKNGNCHIWFKRDDLVEKVNRLLGEYYGAPIPEERGPDEDSGLHDAKTTPAKNFGFFPTPPEAARIAIERANVIIPIDAPQITILEPSAGTGNLASRCILDIESLREQFGRDHCNQAEREKEWLRNYRQDNIVDCIEIQPHLANALAMSGKYRKVINADFLKVQPTPVYDRVIMNPPFDRERDIDHVMHALDFLKDDGLLVAIMSAGTEFRETRKSIAFRNLMKSMGARFEELPPGSFSSVGTNINTIVLWVRRNGSPSRWSPGQAFE